MNVPTIKDSLHRSHSRVHKKLKTSAKHQHRGYGEPNQIVRFHSREWVWRAHSRQGGKLRYTNRGPWLVLAKTGPVMYNIQRHSQADPEIVHVDKLMPYYPDFGDRLHSWIETHCLTQYRDQEVQTPKPVLQDQTVAAVYIPPPIPDTALAPEPTEAHPDAPSPAEKPVETNEAHTSPTEPEVQPTVLETLLDSTPYPHQESLIGSSDDAETETVPMLHPEDVLDQLHPVPADSNDPDTNLEVEHTDLYNDPSLGLHETPTGSRSLVPLPRRGTQSCKQPDRYTSVRRLQVLPVNKAQTGLSVWLFLIIGIAVILSKSFSSPQ